MERIWECGSNWNKKATEQDRICLKGSRVTMPGAWLLKYGPDTYIPQGVLLGMQILWPTGTWKDAQYCYSSEKCKSKPQWDITSHLSEWPSSKRPQTTSAGEDVKREPRAPLAGCRPVQPRWRAVWTLLKKLKVALPCGPAPTPGVKWGCELLVTSDSMYPTDCSTPVYISGKNKNNNSTPQYS